MEQIIRQRLYEIEKTQNVRILFAVESGSRAWGIASPDSDYDVRFIYVRPKNDYLRLDEFRDVIELPIDDELDINGWDLKKALALLYRSNPTLFEWLSSPVIYLKTRFVEDFKRLAADYFSKKKSLYHYVSMAKGNYREYLKGDIVKAKKYFYVLRPVLACRWIIDKNTPPPMLFSELEEHELPAALKKEVETLLDIKINSPEIKEIPRIDALNEFLDEEISSVKSKIDTMKEEQNNDWGRLNEFFLGALADNEV